MYLLVQKNIAPSAFLSVKRDPAGGKSYINAIQYRVDPVPSAASEGYITVTRSCFYRAIPPSNIVGSSKNT